MAGFSIFLFLNRNVISILLHGSGSQLLKGMFTWFRRIEGKGVNSFSFNSFVYFNFGMESLYGPIRSSSSMNWIPQIWGIKFYK